MAANGTTSASSFGAATSSAAPKELNFTGGKNRYKFARLADRVNAIDVSIARKLRGGLASESSISDNVISTVEGELTLSAFSEELELIRDRISLESFVRLFNDISPLCYTTAQLLYHQEHIVSSILQSIEHAVQLGPSQGEALIAMTHLVAVLARDTGSEFYPFFPRVVKTLVTLVDPTQPEVSGEFFRTLSYLFKYLHKSILRDLDALRNLYSPLLGHSRDYIRSFAAETFSFLLRKLKREQLENYLGTFLGALQSGSRCRDDDLVDGVALMLSGLVKSVQGQLHSRAIELLSYLLELLDPNARPRICELSESAEPENTEQQKRDAIRKQDTIFIILDAMFVDLCKHTNKVSAKQLWVSLHEKADAVLDRTMTLAQQAEDGTFSIEVSKNDLDSVDYCSVHLTYLLTLIRKCISFGKGALVDAEETSRVLKLLRGLYLAPQIQLPSGNRAKAHREVGQTPLVELSILSPVARSACMDLYILSCFQIEPIASSLSLAQKSAFAFSAVHSLYSISQRLLSSAASQGLFLGRNCGDDVLRLLERLRADRERISPTAMTRILHIVVNIALSILDHDVDVSLALLTTAITDQSLHVKIELPESQFLVFASFALKSFKALKAEQQNLNKSTSLKILRRSLLILRAWGQLHSENTRTVADFRIRINECVADIVSHFVSQYLSGQGSSTSITAFGEETPSRNTWTSESEIINFVLSFVSAAWRAKIHGASKEQIDRQKTKRLSAGNVDTSSCLIDLLQWVAHYPMSLHLLKEVREQLQTILKTISTDGQERDSAVMEVNSICQHIERIHLKSSRICAQNFNGHSLLIVILKSNVNCPSHAVRLETLSLLLLWERICYHAGNLCNGSAEVAPASPRRTRQFAERQESKHDDDRQRKTAHGNYEPTQDNSIQDMNYCMIELCLQIEHYETTVFNEREISSRVEKLLAMLHSSKAAMINSGDVSAEVAESRACCHVLDVVARFMFGRLHVKYAPLWAFYTRYLKQMAAINGSKVSGELTESKEGINAQNLLWAILLEELGNLRRRSLAITSHGLSYRQDVSNTFLVEENEVLQSAGIEDGADNSTTEPVKQFYRSFLQEATEDRSLRALRGDREIVTDTATQYELIIEILRDSVSLAEKKARVLVPFFLMFLRDEYMPPTARCNDSSTVPSSLLQPRLREDLEPLDTPSIDSVLKQAISTIHKPNIRQGERIHRSTSFIVSSLESEIQILELNLLQGTAQCLSGSETAQENPEEEQEEEYAISSKVRRRQLIAYLRLFESWKGIKSLFGSELLRREVFFRFLIRPDEEVARLSLACLCNYKLPYLLPYRDSLEALIRETSFREQLATWRLGADDGVVQNEHRLLLIPVVVRILFGKMLYRSSGKSSKDSLANRRNTILAFLSALQPEEVGVLVHLLLRPFLSKTTSTVDSSWTSTSAALANSDRLLLGEVEKVSLLRAPQSREEAEALVNKYIDGAAATSHTRRTGFLHLLEAVVAQLGQKAAGYVPELMSAVVALCCVTGNADDLEEFEGDLDGNEVAKENKNFEAKKAHRHEKKSKFPMTAEQRKENKSDILDVTGISNSNSYMVPSKEAAEGRPKLSRVRGIRSLCIRRVSDILDKELLVSSLAKNINQLPKSLIGATRPPAVLELLNVISKHRKHIALFQANQGALAISLLACVTAGISNFQAVRFKAKETSGQESRVSKNERSPSPSQITFPNASIFTVILQVIDNLLSYDELLFDSSQVSTLDGVQNHTVLLPFLDDLLHAFYLRFHLAFSVSRGKRGSGASHTFAPLQLSILTRLSKYALAQLKVEDVSNSDANDMVEKAASISVESKSSSSKAIESASLIVAMLLPFLRRERKAPGGERTHSAILNLFHKLLPALPDADRHIAFISRLLGPDGMTSRGLRQQVVAILRAFAAKKSKDGDNDECTEGVAMQASAQYLEDLHAWKASRVEEYDFDRRLGALDELTETSLEKVISYRIAIVPILYTLLSGLYDAELAIRAASGSTLAKFIDTVVAFLSDNAHDQLPEGLMVEIVTSIVMPALRTGLKSDEYLARKASLSLVCHVATTFGSLEDDRAYAHGLQETGNDMTLHSSQLLLSRQQVMLHTDLKLLMNRSDPEQDFLYNVTHVQIHRRARALARIRTYLNDSQSNLSVSTLVHIILPLALHFLYEHEKQTERAAQDEAANLIGTIARHLPWSHYQNLLRGILRQITRRPNVEKALIRAVCNVVDGFHFPVTINDEESVGKVQPIQENTTHVETGLENAVDEDSDNGDVDEVEDLSHNEDTNERSASSKSSDSDKLNRVGSTMLNKLIPELQQYLFQNVDRSYSASNSDALGSRPQPAISKTAIGETQIVRAPIALAIVKALHHLPSRILRQELPRLLLTIMTLLKSREEKIRDSTRQTLVQITQEVGLEYLQLIVHELKSSLSEGYMKHVLGYTVHSILVGISETIVQDSNASVPADSLNSGAAFTSSSNTHPPLAVEKEKDGHLPDTSALARSKKRKAASGVGDAETSQHSAISSADVRSTALDVCISDLVEIFVEDIFGSTGEEKSQDSGYKSKMKEAKTGQGGSKSFDSFEILSRCMSFLPCPSIHVLLLPIVERIQTSEDSKILAKCEEVLRRVAVGLSQNETVEETYLLMYVHEILVASITAAGRSSSNITEPQDADDDEVEDESEQRRSKKSTGGASSRWLVSGAAVSDEVSKKRRQKVKAADVFKVLPDTKFTGFDRYAQHGSGRSAISKRTLSSANGMNTALLVAYALQVMSMQLKRQKVLRKSGQQRRTDGEEHGRHHYISHSKNQPAETTLALADPFLPLLTHCVVTSRDNKVTLLALKVLQYFLDTGFSVLPSLPRILPKLLDGIFNQMRRAAAGAGLSSAISTSAKSTNASGRAETLQICFKTLEHLLRKVESCKLTEGQLKVLLSLLRADVEALDHQNATFALMRALLERKVVNAAIYDLVDRVSQLLVQSERDNVRSLCSKIMLQFLLDYPLGPKRLEQHLQGLLQNLQYVYESGRISVMETLQQLIIKLPSEILDNYSTLVFLPLALRLVNDDSAKCKTMAADVMKLLIRRISVDNLKVIMDLCSQWSKSGFNVSADVPKSVSSASLRMLPRLAMQVAGLAIESRPDIMKSQGHVKEVLEAQVLAALCNEEQRLRLQGAGDAAPVVLPSASDSFDATPVAGETMWQTCYQSLITFEKALVALPTATEKLLLEVIPQSPLCSESLGIEIFSRISSVCLLHEHPWVRLVSARIFGRYFSHRSAQRLHFVELAVGSRSANTNSTKTSREHTGSIGEYLVQEGVLFSLCQRFCQQLESAYLTDVLAEQVIKNLIFVCVAMAKHRKLADGSGDLERSAHEDESEIEENFEEDGVLSGGQALEHNDAALRPIRWLYSRLSYLARRKGDIRRQSVYKFFAAMAVSRDNEETTLEDGGNSSPASALAIARIFLTHALMALVSGQVDGQSDKDSATVQLGQEVLHLLEAQTGPRAFAQAYAAVQSRMTKRKQDRKRKRALEAVLDPEKSTKEKIKRQVAKRKKRHASKGTGRKMIS